ncbi:hypothetical protein ANAEL_02324 [Anaerolineales bacterium]|nr:hypothetical protein ANAEL_02324 [Anaerolineales bacterium]
MKKTRNSIGLILLIFLFFLSGCKSAALQAIEDAASVLQITTGREVDRWTHDKGKALGKPVYPEIFIVYEPINNHTKEEVYAEIVAILKKNNWVGREPITGYDYFKATLQQGGFEISTKVVIGRIKNIVTISVAIH